MPEKFLKNIKPREYQQKIFETCVEKNCLVVLPTGIGKTLIALMLTINRMTKFPGEKVVFLAPTKPLAEQHINYFKKHLPELFGDMQLFTGMVKAEQRKKIWQTSDIIFSTPQCVANDLKNNLYDLKDVCLLIEDEAHRCLKNYDYNYLAQEYQKHSKHPRILGLTASPGSEKNKIKEICKNLYVEEVELRTRESHDVKEYLQKLEFKKIIVKFPAEFEQIRQLLKKIFDRKIEELKNRKLLFQPATKKNLLELQGKLMKQIAGGNRNFNLLIGVSACAQVIKLQHALELLETQTIYSTYNYMNEIYNQASQGKSRAVKHLIKQENFNKAYSLLIDLLAKKIEHPKLSELKEIIIKERLKNPKVKIIVFAQYRDTLVRICKELSSINGINARVFVGQAKKGTGATATGLSQKEQQEMIRDFSLGKINILCATSIAEEGLDIIEVNSVIFYEPIPSAIRAIQRAGRTARLMPGKLIILITKSTRDEAYYYASKSKEKKMHSAIDSIKQDLNNKDLNNEENFNKNNKQEHQTWLK